MNMIKRAACAVTAVVLTAAMLTGCGNQIGKRNIKFIKVEKEVVRTDDDKGSSFAENFPDPIKDIDDMTTDNLDFYKERLVVAGDSIAYGWRMYNVMPPEKVIAQGGISTAGYSRWEYDTTGKTMSMINTMKAVRPKLLYISLGMNDVGNISEETYASQYKDLVNSILKAVPDCYIVAASITPIAKNNDYPKLSNSKILKYNEKLRETINTMGKQNVIYFNVYPTLLDANEYMDTKYDSGDGLHINETAYKHILVEVTKRLNQELAMPKIQAAEEARNKAAESSSKADK